MGKAREKEKGRRHNKVPVVPLLLLPETPKGESLHEPTELVLQKLRMIDGSMWCFGGKSLGVGRPGPPDGWPS